MAKMKIYEIAKSLNIKSTDMVKMLNDNGFEVKSHNSNIEDNAIAFLLKSYAPKTEEKQQKKPESVNEEKVVPTPRKEETIEVKMAERKTDEKKEESLNMTEPIKKADEIVQKVSEEKTINEQKPVIKDGGNSSSNNGGTARPYNNNNNRDSNGGAARPYNNNNNGGAARPYNNNNNN
ncbi:MAG: translation initiation factor IF-2 N-terminal domain-containing protein, partial [Velocimicrobium sp.]